MCSVHRWKKNGQFAQSEIRFLGHLITSKGLLPLPANTVFSLTKKDNHFLWTVQCDNSFQYIKNSLGNPNILTQPDCSKPFVLQRDASGQGFVLSQDRDGKLLPVRLIFVFYSVKQNEVYLFRSRYVVCTDHKPLVYWKAFKDIVKKRFRWIEYLEETNVNIVYIKE